MELLQKLGGRKFILALIAIAVGTAIELNTDRGLSATMAGLLGTLVAAFSAANYAVTKKHMESRGGKDSSLDDLKGLIENRNSTDETVVKGLVDALTGIHTEMAAVKATTTQVGQAVLNVSKAVTQKGG